MRDQSAFCSLLMGAKWTCAHLAGSTRMNEWAMGGLEESSLYWMGVSLHMRDSIAYTRPHRTRSNRPLTTPQSHPPSHTHASFQVVHEVYDEVVFWEPTEAFYALWNARVVGPAPHSQLEQFFLQFDPDYEYRRLQHARQRVAAITANVKGQIAALESAA